MQNRAPCSWTTGCCLLALAAVLACGSEADVTAHAPVDLEYSGLYDVEGSTTSRGDTEGRRITGKLIVAAREDTGQPGHYTATFNMRTAFATPDGPVAADVIGSGKGERAEAGLVGSAETQLLMAAIPGLDPKFPWIPGRLGPRVISDFEMKPQAEGGFVIEIQTRGAAGEEYDPTFTTLRAVRTGPPVESLLPKASGSAPASP